MTDNLRDKFVDIALKAKEKFEDKHDCTLESAQGSHFEESEPELAEEFKVKGLIETPAALPVTTGGRIYVRESTDGDISVNCLFHVTLDDQEETTRHGHTYNKELAENKAFQSHYNVETEEWGDLHFSAY